MESTALTYGFVQIEISPVGRGVPFWRHESVAQPSMVRGIPVMKRRMKRWKEKRPERVEREEWVWCKGSERKWGEKVARKEVAWRQVEEISRGERKVGEGERRGEARRRRRGMKG